MEQVESSNSIVESTEDNRHADPNSTHHDAPEEGFGAIFVDGVYQPKAHYACEKKRFERDMRISTIVDDLGEDTCNFVEVSSAKSGTVTVLTYHPNPTAELPEGLTWTPKPAIYVKNAGRFYKEAANGQILWQYKVLSGPVHEIIERDFTDDFMEGNYKNNQSEKFFRKVANFIQDYPHEDAKQYGVYLKYFKDMISMLDDAMSDVDMELLMISIAKAMKRVADFKDKDLPEKELYKKIITISTKMTVQQCSKNVHYKLDVIDKIALAAKNDLMALSDRADKQRESERALKQAKIDEFKARAAARSKGLPAPPQKRKLEEITNGQDSEDQPPAKEMRIEETE